MMMMYDYVIMSIFYITHLQEIRLTKIHANVEPTGDHVSKLHHY